MDTPIEDNEIMGVVIYVISIGDNESGINILGLYPA